jgi:hypothetical protein
MTIYRGQGGLGDSYNDPELVHTSGDETIEGVKTFTSTIIGTASGHYTKAEEDAALAGKLSSSNGSVTYAKIQNVTAGKVLGRNTSGSGVVQELPIAVDSIGNVLVGATSAWAKVSVQSSGNTSATQVVSFRDSSTNEKFVVRSDGYTYAPYWYANTTGSGVNVFVDTNGGLARSTSSLKYKKNVLDAWFGLSDLIKLRSVTYESKSESDEGKTFGGLIAEEVHEAGLTEFVQYAEDGTPDALAYGNMVSLCIKAIQEQQSQISSQAAEIKTLNERVAALEIAA